MNFIYWQTTGIRMIKCNEIPIHEIKTHTEEIKLRNYMASYELLFIGRQLELEW